MKMKVGDIDHEFVYWTVQCRSSYITVVVKTFELTNVEEKTWEELFERQVTITIDDLIKLGELECGET